MQDKLTHHAVMLRRQQVASALAELVTELNDPEKEPFLEIQNVEELLDDLKHLMSDRAHEVWMGVRK